MSETVNKVAILSSAVKHALLADVQYYDFHASSAFNRKMKGIITPGFYGGFEPALAGGLNLKITSLQGPGGHGVASVDVNNHQITVQQIEDVTLAIPVNGVTRVMLEANYQYGVKTSQVDDSSDIHAARIFTANISVPLADNHLEICRVTVPADATELTLDMIDSSYRRNKALGITLSSEIDSDADHIGASSHAVKKAVKAARDETEKQIEELVDNAPASLDTLKKIADAINNDPDFFNTLNAVLALKAPLHDPALTGIATVPTPPLSVSNKQIANTEYVQAAVAALVGSSPEALDTLAELADALGNDPNFATTMLNKLAGKQPLHEVLTSLSGLNSAANKLAFFNGPNSMALANLTAVGRVLIGQESVAKVLEYLGLVETINRAAGALQKEQNLNDVPDKAKARAALQLGTVATLDVTSSATDSTLGHVLKVGDRGLGLAAINYVGIDFNTYKFAAGETLFLRMADCTNIPAGIDTGYVVYAYVNVIGIRNVNNNVAVLIGDNGGAKYYWAVRSTNSSGVTTWSVRILPQSAADINAMQRDPIGTIGNNGSMASANTPGWWLVGVANPDTVADFPKYPDGRKLYGYGFMLVSRTGNVWLQQYFSHHGVSASRQTWNGDLSEQISWVIDYNTANKPGAVDVGALPITGGTLNGSLGIGVANALGGNSIVLGDNDTGFKQEGDGILNVYANSALVMRFIASLIESLKPLKVNGNCIATGEIQAANGAVRLAADGNIYGSMWGGWMMNYLTNTFQLKGNFTPAGQAYTKAESDARYVQNIRVSAPQERKFRDGAGWSSNDSAFATAIWMVGGSSNVGGLYVRYLQKNINGTWINVTE